jgi:hypothetical protein
MRRISHSVIARPKAVATQEAWAGVLVMRFAYFLGCFVVPPRNDRLESAR